MARMARLMILYLKIWMRFVWRWDFRRSNFNSLALLSRSGILSYESLARANQATLLGSFNSSSVVPAPLRS